jgi:RNA polymerase sigma-70 factor (ECF subfamily)
MVVVMLNDLQAGEDVVQETFVYLIGHAEDYDPARSNLRTWLRRIALSLAHNELRRRRRKPTVSLENPVRSDGELHPISDLLADRNGAVEAHAARHALELIGRLDENDRQILVLRYVEGLPPREIAAVLGINAKAASMRLWRAIKELQRMLHREDDDSP